MRMTRATIAARGVADDEERPFEREAVLDVLSNRRRRYVIHYLKWLGRETDLRDLAEHVAAWENEVEVTQLDYTDRKRVQNALHQFHLPKMNDGGFVDYDSRRGVVGLSRQTASTNFYVDVLPPWTVPWGLYYLGLSALSFVCFGAAAVGLPPFTLVSPLSWSLFLGVVLAVSSVGHCYDDYYRMRLGAREHPPETRT
ncbi:DUF7344 domain-containing protein [Halomarina oriensis]|uniref:DUF7344 domain-containing protein n=1 Tax=Halomarina oriensis TaxID=671145 RepID=A0A6B0GIA3_9EURY|nr:hypothetical protein [Halomarina oriensis]MWG34350.1 hypothetical protein [Halomarina oriensis]